MKSIITNKYLKGDLEMEHFIDMYNNVMITDIFHSQIFNSLFGKTITMMLLLIIVIASTAVGSIIILLINCLNYIWNQLTPGYELLELGLVLSSFASFAMFSLFFYEISKALDKKEEEIERKNRLLKEENDALKLILQEKDKEQE